MEYLQIIVVNDKLQEQYKINWEYPKLSSKGSISDSLKKNTEISHEYENNENSMSLIVHE